ncbi:spermatogenesis-associated serine-rich protein 2 isoform X3 [Falco cherrug]|uniref:spermatogenesis-associated serine-rich protein 2 isoform X3 n=1 Tax=Falco cherrug TaxID=345164 RepID=UPI002479B917|nr:spermatogenesis-associated serine-rich protein 2 isoform X3 [Falco cherrug]XP_055552858.1 spermatogenesis-associated serine-rich protein 2 isoform X3 [Falco cherrug]XP_055552859.1 spermatogenesis-associated serine-rich protein 2 isoform X3 [Falco cherrug]XP_055552860.1 spermatogenesis-associated serine-rich protein 2 isoform X3 [Falco cherrug]
MSKKQNTKDPSGFIFDVQSNTVMAQGGTFENMKEKINAVRAIVPNRSNNEIVLVLQHFDNCVDKTVQAFMEGNASEVLKEWTVTGKKKNKKKKTKPKPQAESNPGLPEPGKLVSTEEEQSANSEKGGINGFHVNGCAHDTESVDSLSEGLDALSIDARELEDCEPAAPDMPDRTAVPELENGIADFDTKSLIMHPSQSPSSLRQRPEQRSASRSLSRSTASNSTPASLSVTRLEDVPVSPVSKKLGSNIEKSVKDLQRCTVSLARYRVVVKEEMDASIKKMKQAFAELQSSLMDREVALLAEMDKVKAEAMEILVSRQKKAEALKKLTDVAVRMSEEQLVELRADIKHFVSERKYDEDLGRVARFTCDLDALKKSIASFGQDVSLPVSHHQEQLLHPLAVQLRHRRVPERSPARPPLPLPPACASASAASLTAAKRTLGGGGRGERRQPPPAAPQRGFPRAAASGSGAQSPGPAPHRPPPAATTATDRGTGSPPPPAPSPPRPASARATAGAPPPPAQRPRGGFPQPKGGLPQRKPRASRQEGANS